MLLQSKYILLRYQNPFRINANVFVYGKLRFCGRGFSEGHERSELAQAKSEASKQATNFVLAKTSNFLYTVLPFVLFH